MMTQYLAINAAKVAGISAASGATVAASAAGISIGLALSTKIVIAVVAVAAIAGGGIAGNIVANSDVFKDLGTNNFKSDYFKNPKVLKAWEEISLDPSTSGLTNETAAPSMTSTEVFARIEPTAFPARQSGRPGTSATNSSTVSQKPTTAANAPSLVNVPTVSTVLLSGSPENLPTVDENPTEPTVTKLPITERSSSFPPFLSQGTSNPALGSQAGVPFTAPTIQIPIVVVVPTTSPAIGNPIGETNSLLLSPFTSNPAVISSTNSPTTILPISTPVDISTVAPTTNFQQIVVNSPTAPLAIDTPLVFPTPRPTQIQTPIKVFSATNRPIELIAQTPINRNPTSRPTQSLSSQRFSSSSAIASFSFPLTPPL